jgi:hypothetical protein
MGGVKLVLSTCLWAKRVYLDIRRLYLDMWWILAMSSNEHRTLLLLDVCCMWVLSLVNG